MNRVEARELVENVTQEWLADPDGAVVWVGAHDGRWGMRMTQECREATTVWFTVGEITVGYDAYLLAGPRYRAEDVYRLCLRRNLSSWPASIRADDRGDLYVGGRIPLTDLSRARIEEAVAAVYETIELSFGPIIAVGFTNREKSP